MVVPRTILVLRSLSCDPEQYEKVGNYSGPDLNRLVQFRANPDTGAKIEFGRQAGYPRD